MLRFAILVPLLWLGACAKPDTPEQQVRQVIERMEQAAEARSVGDVLELLSRNYRDAHGSGPDEVQRLARGYFIANQSIYLLTRVQSLSFPHPDEARATVQVAMVGRDADAAGTMPITADLEQFEIVLRPEDGEWKITWAQWQRR